MVKKTKTPGRNSYQRFYHRMQSNCTICHKCIKHAVLDAHFTGDEYCQCIIGFLDAIALGAYDE